MPSPFPGMDPFLENPDIFFPDFHDSFVAYLREGLQPRLPVPYIAVLGRRTWIEVSERFIEPDVQVARGRLAPPPTAAQSAESAESVASAVAVVAVAERPLVIRVPHDERSEPLVEIYRGRGFDRRLVTSIELLSPASKTPGEHGRDLYLRKQREILAGKVHLVEIDLLRAGEHTTAVPRHRLVKAAGDYDYHVSIHHFDNLEDYFVYPIRLNQRLPVIEVPLLPGDRRVPLDLQAVLQRTYDAGPYHREIDYLGDEPDPPLGDAWKAWLRKALA